MLKKNDILCKRPGLGISPYFFEKLINKKLKKSADHWLSVNEKELNELVYNSKNILKSIGIAKKYKLDCEENTFKLARRSVYANRDIAKNKIIDEKDLICKRPGTGISASRVFDIIGKKVRRNIKKDDYLKIIKLL